MEKVDQDDKQFGHIISLNDSNNVNNTIKISKFDVKEINLLHSVSRYKILLHFSHYNMACVTYY